MVTDGLPDRPIERRGCTIKSNPDNSNTNLNTASERGEGREASGARGAKGEQGKGKRGEQGKGKQGEEDSSNFSIIQTFMISL